MTVTFSIMNLDITLSNFFVSGNITQVGGLDGFLATYTGFSGLILFSFEF